MVHWFDRNQTNEPRMPSLESSKLRGRNLFSVFPLINTIGQNVVLALAGMEIEKDHANAFCLFFYNIVVLYNIIDAL